jgi:hypothetical protein
MTGLAALTLAVAVTAGAAPSAGKTADQRFVAELASARTVSRSAFRQLKGTPPTIDGVNKAKTDLTVAQKHLRAASALAPQTIGGAESESVLTGLKTATTETNVASTSVKKGDYDGARVSIGEAISATTATQSSFGVPLAKDFTAFAVYRDFSNILGFEEFQGLTARVGAPIAKIVFGLAGRETANMSESGGKRATPPLPITKLALYTIQEPSGSFTSNWCKLFNGIAVCELDPTMEAEEIFSVAFGPRVAKGTKFLVKFWSTDGKRSHAIMTTR